MKLFHISELFKDTYLKLQKRTELVRVSQEVLEKNGITIPLSDINLSRSEITVKGSRIVKQEVYLKTEKIIREINEQAGALVVTKIS